MTCNAHTKVEIHHLLTAADMRGGWGMWLEEGHLAWRVDISKACLLDGEYGECKYCI